jgi:hypothetical protein
MVGSSSYMLKGCYLLFLLPTHYVIPSLTTMLYLLSMLYSVGCSFFIFLCVLGRCLPLSEGVEDAVNAKDIGEVGESSVWVVSRIYHQGICDIDGDADGDGFECCFKHLSILSISFLYCVFSDGKGYERRESNPQRWCLLVAPAPSLVAWVARFIRSIGAPCPTYTSRQTCVMSPIFSLARGDRLS